MQMILLAEPRNRPENSFVLIEICVGLCFLVRLPGTVENKVYSYGPLQLMIYAPNHHPLDTFPDTHST